MHFRIGKIFPKMMRSIMSSLVKSLGNTNIGESALVQKLGEIAQEPPQYDSLHLAVPQFPFSSIKINKCDSSHLPLKFHDFSILYNDVLKMCAKKVGLQIKPLQRTFFTDSTQHIIQINNTKYLTLISNTQAVVFKNLLISSLKKQRAKK